MSKILVIDDEAWLREMILLALQQRGFEVIEASDSDEGVATARDRLPDLILCDVNMDQAGAGYNTLSKLREDPTTASIPFILMTGLADAAGGTAPPQRNRRCARKHPSDRATGQIAPM